ncbi:tape measure protein [Vibrio quintilis]|uniref:Tape measure protein N-terminal domain-containing protein n=1 Tax=Vibrio quintilis TaxID=1117707 RepID=A0A1M7YQW5_9VIBR|nr:tape measure protein [Vibrio quintilis]SHO55022.1 hypothetical protein VQ7734_00741 [Vibrio quintilis]
MNTNDLKFTLRFNAENKEFIGQVRAAAGSVDSLGTHSTTTGKKLNALARETQTAGAGFGSLAGKITGLVGGFSALMAANDAKDKLGQYQDIRTQITALVGGQQQWIETEQYLNQVAEDHNKTLLDMAGNYSRLAVLQEAGLTTQKETRSIFEGMSNAQSQLGASSAQLEQAMYGLSQAISSPVVHAEELNQVVEPLPGLLNKLDKAAGLQSGGFRKMVNNGKVTSKFFKDTLVKALNEYQGAAARTASNITAQQAELTRAYQQMVVAYEQPISEVFGTSVKASSSVLRAFADNAETVSSVIGVTLAAAAGRGAVAVGALTREKIGNTISARQKLQATVAETQATIAETQAELAATQAEIRHLEAMQLSNNQKFRATGAEASLTAARIRETAITNTLTAAQTRLNLVTRASTSVMGLLGGPVGVVMMAAAALSYFATVADNTKKPTEALNDEVSQFVKSFQDVNQAGKQVALKKLGQDAMTARLELAKTQIELRKLTSELVYMPTGQRAMAQRELMILQHRVEKLNNQIAAAGKKSQALLALKMDKISENNSQQQTDDDQAKQKAIDSGKKLLANLQKQVALYGQTSQVAKVRYETEHGSLQGINDQLKKQLLLQAQLLDEKAGKTKTQNTDVTSFYAQTDEMESAWLKRLAMEAAMENKAVVEENYAYNQRLDNLKSMHDKAVVAAQDNKAELAAIEAEYQYQQEIAESDHQARIHEIQKSIQAQKEEDNKSYWERYLDSAKQNLTDFDDLAASTIDSFSSGMGSAFESMIFDADSLGDAMFNLASGMARSIVNALGKMAAQWLAYQAVQMLVDSQANSMKAIQVSTDAQIQSQMAGLNAYSSTAAIPITGPALAPAAMTAALAATQPVAATIQTLAFSGITGQAHDGIGRVPTSNEGTWLLRADEMVLNPGQAEDFRWMVDALQQMKQSLSANVSGSGRNSERAKDKAIVINCYGVTKDAVNTSVTETSDTVMIDIIVNKAVDKSLKAVYSDFDNGGPISRRAKNSG